MPRQRSEVFRLVGQRFRQLRKASGRTQDEVAELAGFSSKNVSEIERGLRDPPLTTLERLAVRGLGCALHDLMLGPDVTPTSSDQYRNRLPQGVRALSNDLAALPSSFRGRAVRIAREVIKLAQSRQTWPAHRTRSPA